MKLVTSNESTSAFADKVAKMVEDAQQKALENARSFLAMKVLSPEQIAQGTGLPLEQILELQKQITVQA